MAKKAATRVALRRHRVRNFGVFTNASDLTALRRNGQALCRKRAGATERNSFVACPMRAIHQHGTHNGTGLIADRCRVGRTFCLVLESSGGAYGGQVATVRTNSAIENALCGVPRGGYQVPPPHPPFGHLLPRGEKEVSTVSRKGRRKERHGGRSLQRVTFASALQSRPLPPGCRPSSRPDHFP
jgi:hypothetical protein